MIHHIGCHRYKLQEITIFRTAPTPVNPKRWQTAQVRDVMTYGDPIFVKLKQHFGRSFLIRVSPFVPLEGDETTRAGRDPVTGESYDEPLGLFALKRAHDVIDDYRAYIKENWYREFVSKCARPGVNQYETEGLISDVYNLGLRHLDRLPHGPSWNLYRSSGDCDPRTVTERNFMQVTLMMCFVLRECPQVNVTKALLTSLTSLTLQFSRRSSSWTIVDRPGGPRSTAVATTREIYSIEGLTRYTKDDRLAVGLHPYLLRPETVGQTASQSLDNVDRGATTRLLAQYLLRQFHFSTRDFVGHA